MTEFPTINHVALTVSDLERSVPWYQQLFDADPVLDEDTGPFRHVVWSIGSTLVGLHQFPDGRSETFDERRVGLDHLSFACTDRTELERWESRLTPCTSPTAGSSTPATAPACPSAIPTTSPWSSLLLRRNDSLLLRRNDSLLLRRNDNVCHGEAVAAFARRPRRGDPAGSGWTSHRVERNVQGMELQALNNGDDWGRAAGDGVGEAAIAWKQTQGQLRGCLAQAQHAGLRERHQLLEHAARATTRCRMASWPRLLRHAPALGQVLRPGGEGVVGRRVQVADDEPETRRRPSPAGPRKSRRRPARGPPCGRRRPLRRRARRRGRRPCRSPR